MCEKIDLKAVNLLKDFSASGIHILVADGQLKIESVKPLTDDQRNLIKKLKSDLLDYFSDQAKFSQKLSEDKLNQNLRERQIDG
jgi:hypothetical protein